MSRQLFEVEFPGFDGGTDETDHLIKWVTADNEAQVEQSSPGCKVQPLPHSIEEELPFGTIDYHLPTDADALRARALEAAP